MTITTTTQIPRLIEHYSQTADGPISRLNGTHVHPGAEDAPRALRMLAEARDGATVTGARAQTGREVSGDAEVAATWWRESPTAAEFPDGTRVAFPVSRGGMAEHMTGTVVAVAGYLAHREGWVRIRPDVYDRWVDYPTAIITALRPTVPTGRYRVVNAARHAWAETDDLDHARSMAAESDHIRAEHATESGPVWRLID